MCARAVDTNVPAGAAVQRPPRRELDADRGERQRTDSLCLEETCGQQPALNAADEPVQPGSIPVVIIPLVSSPSHCARGRTDPA